LQGANSPRRLAPGGKLHEHYNHPSAAGGERRWARIVYQVQPPGPTTIGGHYGCSQTRTVGVWKRTVSAKSGQLARQESPARAARMPEPASWKERSWVKAWPLTDFLELGALAGSVPCARYHTRQIMWEWGLTRLNENVELVVSELMTNAVTASWLCDRPLPVRMWLMSDRARVQVLVWDGNPDPPLLVFPGDDTETGRGLFLVNAVSASWDWYTIPGMAGKVVRALVTD
jgi:anti-sigma regulatory factor (Ser/Thr protein kinase)